MEHILDHQARAVARLIEQYRGKVSYPQVVRLMTAEHQVLEDELWAVYGQVLGAATGPDLDVWGRIVGQARQPNQDDTAYRLWIQARLIILRTGGTPDSLVDIFALLVGGGVTVEIVEQFPAGVSVRLDGVDVTISATLAPILRQAKAAGVRAVLEWYEGAMGDRFEIDGLPTQSTLSGPTIAGATALPIQVGDVAAFPNAGTVIVQPGTTQEVLAYVKGVGASLTVPAMANPHDAGALVILLDESTGKGLGSTTDATAGGELAGAVKA